MRSSVDWCPIPAFMVSLHTKHLVTTSHFCSGGESDRYSKIREAVQLYRAIQIGLTAVKPNPSSATGFSSRSFNFYVLPPSGCTITWNTDAMGFLTSHGFEYNKLAREGIPYLNRTQEAQRFKRNKDPMVGSWSSCFLPTADAQSVQKARQERGFTTVIDLLISARKPIVGHNMFFDLAFIYQQFIDPLPSSLSTYSQRLSKYFPEIYDTKVSCVVNFQKPCPYLLYPSGAGNLNRGRQHSTK